MAETPVQSSSPDRPTLEGQTRETPVNDAPQVEYRLRCPQLPLAVYREVAAHLRQIDGVETGLLPQSAKTFEYLQSQVGGLWLRYAADQAETCQAQVETILAYYGDRYGEWETLSS